MHRLQLLEFSFEPSAVDETDSLDKFLLILCGLALVGVLGVVLDFGGVLMLVFDDDGDGVFGITVFCFSRIFSSLCSSCLLKIVVSDPFRCELVIAATLFVLFVLDSDDCIAYSLRKLLISIKVSFIVSHFDSLSFSSATFF